MPVAWSILTMTGIELSIRSHLTHGVQDALRVLLSSKHLYQSVEVSAKFLSDYVTQAQVGARAEAERSVSGVQLVGLTRADWVAEREHTAVRAATTLVNTIATMAWLPKGIEPQSVPAEDGLESGLSFSLPTIQTMCPFCEHRWPFNPGSNTSWGSLHPVVFYLAPPKPKNETRHPSAQSRTKAFISPGKFSELVERLIGSIKDGSYKADELHVLPYQCQQCKTAPVSFVVRRSGLKLTLVGRDPLEIVQVPSFLPKVVRRYYSDALVAHHAGQTLAGLFLLRTFIEQYWVSLGLPSSTPERRQTGDELGEKYNQTLPNEFKAQFPSLPDLYSRLSAAMHSADASLTLFDLVAAAIIEHFDARRLLKLDLPESSPTA